MITTEKSEIGDRATRNSGISEKDFGDDDIKGTVEPNSLDYPK